MGIAVGVDEIFTRLYPSSVLWAARARVWLLVSPRQTRVYPLVLPFFTSGIRTGIVATTIGANKTPPLAVMARREWSPLAPLITSTQIGTNESMGVKPKSNGKNCPTRQLYYPFTQKFGMQLHPELLIPGSFSGPCFGYWGPYGHGYSAMVNACGLHKS